MSQSIDFWKKMKARGKPAHMTPEAWEHYLETMRKLAERIAYHEAKIEEERAAREER